MQSEISWPLDRFRVPSQVIYGVNEPIRGFNGDLAKDTDESLRSYPVKIQGLGVATFVLYANGGIPPNRTPYIFPKPEENGNGNGRKDLYSIQAYLLPDLDTEYIPGSYACKLVVPGCSFLS